MVAPGEVSLKLCLELLLAGIKQHVYEGAQGTTHFWPSNVD